MGNSQLISFSQEELERLLKTFKKIDDNHNGEIDIEELQKISTLSTNPLVKRVFDILDTDKSNSINFKEFVQGISQLYGNNDEAKLKFAFKIYDINNDGYISNGELFQTLKMMVGDNLQDIQLQQLIDRTIIKADKDKDGKICYEEFKEMVKDLNIASKLKIDQF